MSDSLQKIKEVLDKVEIPKDVDPSKPLIKRVCCPQCKAWVDFKDLKLVNTSKAFGIVDPVCDKCAPMFKDFAKIACIRCKQVTACLPKHTDPKSGFKFEAGKYYHVDKCPECDPTASTSNLLEKQEHDQRNNRR